MAKLLFLLALCSIAAAPAGAGLGGYLLAGSALCVVGWLLFGPRGHWL